MESNPNKSVELHIKDGALMPIVEAIRHASNSELQAIAEVADILKVNPKGENDAPIGEKVAPARESLALFNEIENQDNGHRPYKSENSSPNSENIAPIGENVAPPRSSPAGEDFAPVGEKGKELERDSVAPDRVSAIIPDDGESESNALASGLGGMTKQLASLLKATEKLASESTNESSDQSSQTEVHHAPSHQETSQANQERSQHDNQPSITVKQPEVIVTPVVEQAAPAVTATEKETRKSTESQDIKESVLSAILEREANSLSAPVGASTGKEIRQHTESTSIMESVSSSATEKNATDPFKGYWKDDRGQLRHSSGRFASKDEKEGYSKSQQAKEANAKEKELSLIGKLAKGVSSVAKEAHSASKGAAEEATAVAAGGSFTYAAKELFDLGVDVKDQALAVRDKAEQLRESRKAKRERKAVQADKAKQKQEKKNSKAKQEQFQKSSKAEAGRIAELQRSTAAESEKSKVLKEVSTRNSTLEKASDAVIATSSQSSSSQSSNSQSSSSQSSNSQSSSSQSSSSQSSSSQSSSSQSSSSQSSNSQSDDSQANHNSESVVVIAASEVNEPASQIATASQAHSEANMERISIDKATIESATVDRAAIESAKQQAGAGSVPESSSKTQKAIESSSQQQVMEILREQSTEEATYHAEMIKQAEDTISAIKGIDIACNGSAGSALDSVGEMASDLFDRDGKKGKRGRGRKGRTLRDKLLKRRASSPASVIESASKNPVSKNKSFSLDFKQGGKGGGIMSKLGSGLKTLGKGGALAGLFAGVDKVMDVKDRDDLSNSQKGAQVASTAVGAGGGAVGGGMAGAAIGTMILPGVGTAVGGFIGSVLGGMGGESVGSTIGESISDFMGSDKSLTESISGWWGSSSSDSTTSEAAQTSPKTPSPDKAAKAERLQQMDSQREIMNNSSVMTSSAPELHARDVMTEVAKNKTVTASPEKISAVAVEGRSQHSIKTNQSIKQMEQVSKSQNVEPSVVSLDARSTAALEKLAQLGGNTASSKKNPPQTVQKTAPQGAVSSIPADFNNEYMRVVALDMD